MNNTDNKFFTELGALFNGGAQAEEAAARIEQANERAEKSYENLGKKTSAVAGDMSRFLDRSARASSKAMDNFFDVSSKGFLDFDAVAKKTFDSIVSNFFSMTASMLTRSVLSGLGGLFGGGGGFVSGLLGSRETGGPIPKTGPYLLHGGEYVLSKDMLASMSSAPAGGAPNITVNTPVNINSVGSNIDVKHMAREITRAARAGAAWAVEYSKVNYKVGKKREGEVSL